MNYVTNHRLHFEIVHGDTELRCQIHSECEELESTLIFKPEKRGETHIRTFRFRISELDRIFKKRDRAHSSYSRPESRLKFSRGS